MLMPKLVLPTSDEVGMRQHMRECYHYHHRIQHQINANQNHRQTDGLFKSFESNFF